MDVAYFTAEDILSNSSGLVSPGGDGIVLPEDEWGTGRPY